MELRRICFVTQEWPGVPGCGGIGTAFFELAMLLAQSGYDVDVLFVPGESSPQQFISPALNVQIQVLDLKQYVEAPFTSHQKSHAVGAWLQKQPEYLAINFPDYGGLGFFATVLKQQGLAFSQTLLVGQLHGPTRWAMSLNHLPFSQIDDLMRDHMERESLLYSDIVVSPSRYMLEWAKDQGYVSPQQKALVVPNAHCYIDGLGIKDAGVYEAGIKQIVFVGRHETRKGLDLFATAIERNAVAIQAQKIKVVLLGAWGSTHGIPSELYILERFGPTGVDLEILPALDRPQTLNYLLSASAPLVVVASPQENSPYAVLEPLLLGIPVLSSVRGGACELYVGRQRDVFLFDPTPEALAQKLAGFLSGQVEPPTPSNTVRSAHDKWTAIFKNSPRKSPAKTIDTPLVSFCITHHERPAKLMDALACALFQRYEFLEILVIDDGSTSPEAIDALARVEVILKRVKGRLIRQKNKYLGAARNRLIREAKGQYIVFLDDDNYAFGHMVSTLVRAIEHSGADVVTAQSIYMPADKRTQFISLGESANPVVSYVPTGGPVTLAAVQNVFGDASAIYKTEVLRQVGGFSELYGVGFEDYELFVKIAQAGYKIIPCPVPLYLYEVNKASMLNTTSVVGGQARVYQAFQAGASSRSLRELAELTVGDNLLKALQRTDSVSTRYSGELKSLGMAFEQAKTQQDRLDVVYQLALRMGYGNVAKALKGVGLPPVMADQSTKVAASSSREDLYSWSVTEKSVLHQAAWDEAPNVFLEHLASLLESKFSVCGEVWQCFSVWIRRLEVQPDLLAQLDHQLLLPLIQTWGDLEGASSQYLAVLHRLCIALSNHREAELFSVVFSELYRIESSSYLRTYPDLRSGYVPASPKIFEHFMRYGQAEGREGFHHCMAVVQALARTPTSARGQLRKMFAIR